MKTYFVLLLGLVGLNLNAQFLLKDVDFKTIHQKSIKRYIEDQERKNIVCFDELMASCNVEKDMSGFSKHVAIYTIPDTITKVWKAYKKANPYKTWRGRFISFGLMYSRDDDNVRYKNFKFSGIKKGQIMYVNLRFFKGMYNLATAFEVVEVDDNKKIIQFSYIDGGKAKGVQTMKFESTPEGYTKITHFTEYKSDSHIRDKYIYGHFHKKCIDQYHDNVKKLVLESDDPEELSVL